MQTMLKIYIILILGLSIAYADDKNTTSLNEQDIDRIFLSFVEEKKKKRDEKLKKAAQDKINLEIALQSKNESPNQDVIEETIDLMDLTVEGNISNHISTPIPFTIYGTSCLKGVCILITSAGEFKEGSTINVTGEKIDKITDSFVQTNIRKISI
ncbi:MAG: Unknown protein [uncultured Sulfurovum sp.]|uniref:Uncharacterized protein n=1 Tax=uncultured Sulfurovum sp. TaxID=269237 RepID=A0A6S6SPH2_9BACT|nr:MAG: Unknown protein [uncultured Sulfurovum sp.]